MGRGFVRKVAAAQAPARATTAQRRQVVQSGRSGSDVAGMTQMEKDFVTLLQEFQILRDRFYGFLNGAQPLLDDWDIGENRRILAEAIAARDSEGLRLEDDNFDLGIHIADGGRVGVGISPTVAATQGIGQLQVKRNDGAALVLHRESNDANGPILEFLKRRSGFGVVSAGDILGEIIFSGADGVDAAPGAVIKGGVDTTPGSNDMPGFLAFFVTPDGSESPNVALKIINTGDLVHTPGLRIHTSQIRARDANGLQLTEDNGTLGVFIEDGGQVGVGTAVPDAALHVVTSASEIARLETTTAGGDPLLSFYNPGSGRIGFLQALDGVEQMRLAADEGILTFFTNSTAGGLAERARIDDTRLLLATGLFLETDEVRARDSNGLTLSDDAGILGIEVQDGGKVNIGDSTTAVSLLQIVDAGGLDSATPPRLTIRNSTNGEFNASLQEIASLDFYSDDVSGGSARTRARVSLENTNTHFGTADLTIGLDTSGAFAKRLRLTGNWSVNSQLLVLGDVSAPPKTMMEINSPGGADSVLAPILTIRNTSNVTLDAADQTIAAVDFWSDDASGSGAGVRAAVRLLNLNTSFGTSVLSLWSQGAGGDGTGASFPTYEHMRLAGTGYTEMKAGQSSGLQAAVGGVMFVSITQTGNVGTGEDTLASYSVPANTLATDGDSLWFEASGTTANNANTKTIRANFGTAGTHEIISMSATFTNAEWIIKGRIFRTGAATQKGYAVAHIDANNRRNYEGGLDQTLSGAVSLNITGEATANNDIVLQTFIVGWNANNV